MHSATSSRVGGDGIVADPALPAERLVPADHADPAGPADPAVPAGRHGRTVSDRAILVLGGRLAELAQAAELSVRSILATDPALTGQELLRRLEERARQTAADFARTTAELAGDEDPLRPRRLS